MRHIRVFSLLAALVLLAAACGGESVDETTTTTTSTTTADDGSTTTTTGAGTTTPTITVPEGGGSVEDLDLGELTETDTGLQYRVVALGDGAMPEEGDVVQLHYTGRLVDGTEFDTSRDGEPIAFPVGQGRVIDGFDEGIALFPVGTTATLVIPPQLAYGEQGAGDVIPPGATIVFDVEILDILPGPPEAPTEVDESAFVETESGLRYADIEVGDGASPEDGQLVTVNYTGWLEDGTMFDSSLLTGRPFQFFIGQGGVIPGWDEGVLSMQVGGIRQLVVPPELAYGEQGAGGVIPPNATLIFDVELIAVDDG